MFKHRILTATCLCTCTMLMFSCAQNRTNVTMVQAPEISAAAKYKNISVARFGGQGGDSLANELEAALVNARVQDKPVYKTVVRSPDSRSKYDDAHSLAISAKAQGADAIFSGEITRADTKDERSSYETYVCDQTEKKNKLISKCVSGHKETVHCLERTAALDVMIKMTDVQNESSVYSEAIKKTNSSKGCGNELPTDGRTLITDLYKEIISQVKQKVIPHEAVVSIEIIENGDSLKKSQSQNDFSGAVKFALSGRMDRACEMFKQIEESEKSSVSLYYNLGVCEEASGAFWKANEYYQIADKLTKSPSAQLNSALKRNEENIKRTGKLAENRSDLISSSKIESGAAPQTITQNNKPSQSSQTPLKGATPIPQEMLLMEKRTALVIGNGTYEKGALRNPVNDSRAITQELRKVGFQVISIENADQARMMSAIDEFGRAIKQGGVAMFFYAGHGMQYSGENYLIPVKSDLKSESELSFKAINLGYILTKLDEAKPQVNIVVLDACRDNPFARSWRSAKSGLASIDAPSGTVIAFATAPGKTAADGSGSNGLFTSHFLKQLSVPDQKIEDILKNTRKAVAADSRNEQVPWDSSSMTGDFYFRTSTMDPSEHFTVTSASSTGIANQQNLTQNDPSPNTRAAVVEKTADSQSSSKTNTITNNQASSQTDNINSSGSQPTQQDTASAQTSSQLTQSKVTQAESLPTDEPKIQAKNPTQDTNTSPPQSTKPNKASTQSMSINQAIDKNSKEKMNQKTIPSRTTEDILKAESDQIKKLINSQYNQ